MGHMETENYHHLISKSHHHLNCHEGRAYQVIAGQDCHAVRGHLGIKDRN